MEVNSNSIIILIFDDKNENRNNFYIKWKKYDTIQLSFF